ncbi:MAG: hypothetical protein AB9895_03545 [Negativicutes bacterium]
MNIQPLSGGNIPGTGRAAEAFPKISLNGETLVAISEEQNNSNSAMKVMLSDLKGLLQLRSDLVESLPISLKQVVQNIFQNSSGTDQVSQGLSVLFKSQKTVSDQLLTVVSLLRDTINLRQIVAAEQQMLPKNRSTEISQKNGLLNSNQLAGLSVEQLKIAAASVQKLFSSSQNIASSTGFSNFKLVESLPTPIKQIVQNIFQNFSGADQVSQELPVLSKKQTAISEKLLTVVSLLHETIRLQQMPAANQRRLLNQEMNRSIELLQRTGLPTTYQLDDLPVDQLIKAADSVQELALSVQKSASPNALSSSSNQIFSFALPLFFFGNPRPYPTYVHVYNEDKQFVGTTEKKETWIRLCIDTENIGLVDIAFQMVQNQADDQVNLRVLFDTTGAADSFVEYLSDLRSVFDRLSLKLNDVAVKAPHEGKNG